MPKIHDLVTLHRLIAALHTGWTWSEDELDDLSSDAVDSRYPGDDATLAEAAQAVDLCERICPKLLALLDEL